MKKIKFLSLVTILLFVLNSCNVDDQEPVNIDYVGFVSDFAIGVDPTGTKSQDVSIYATKTKNFDRTFSINIVPNLTTASATAYSIPSSVTIPAGSNTGSFSLNAIGENIKASGLDIVVIEIKSEDKILLGEPIKLNLQQVCPYPETVLDIIFDGYGDETSWEIKDNSDTVLYSAALGTYTEGQVSASATFCLAPGTYTFTINDKYGDGLSYPANGSATITNSGTKLTEVIGDFGYGTSKQFTISN
ncbi:hypothetical protein CJ739_497 [Mariniflexile rhizosphaerae]|uniref:hypothetical protein n=1 Tax=unclassified Mariniflexile TaxID=2643887 RepID=UPI000CB34514|nr:hypothetical protein [Mariniflexile sp. TRM1-10]AXP79595.1 hypothetical protein CJ739_497 [Mariniflexile sp. TRM1-10]PLB18569.1 MAG: hypothetical protein TRG1_2554 [Flavobacteriaceae bacterium FS1-H7996/R]